MSTVNINAANISSIRLADSAAPSAPASGFVQIYVDSNGDLATVKDNSGGIKIATSPSSSAFTLTVDGTGTAARLNANQTFTGTNTFNQDLVLADGIGIDFSATPGTGTSELFDDYEEGAWTPVLGGSTGTSGQTYSKQSGRYTKIGRLVVCSFEATLTAVGTVGNLAIISGLPFTSAATSSDLDSGGLFATFASGLAANQIYVTGYVTNNQTQVWVTGSAAAGTTINNITTTNIWGNSTRITGTITYTTSS